MVPTVSEHRMKYLENKGIVENVLDIKNKNHCNWIATISFYAALHIVDMQLAVDSVHSRSHHEREEELNTNPRITKYVMMRYKQMCTVSRTARYEASSISPAVANQMVTYLHQIEKEYGLS